LSGSLMSLFYSPDADTPNGPTAAREHVAGCSQLPSLPKSDVHGQEQFAGVVSLQAAAIATLSKAHRRTTVRSCAARNVAWRTTACGMQHLDANCQASLTESTFFRRLGQLAMCVLNASSIGQRTLRHPAGSLADPAIARTALRRFGVAPTQYSMNDLFFDVLLTYGNCALARASGRAF
jgi:hypothetical protein